MNKELKENGIRFKNHFNLWFKEEIPNRGVEVKREPRDEYEDDEDYETYGAGVRAQGKVLFLDMNWLYKIYLSISIFVSISFDWFRCGGYQRGSWICQQDSGERR